MKKIFMIIALALAMTVGLGAQTLLVNSDGSVAGTFQPFTLATAQATQTLSISGYAPYAHAISWWPLGAASGVTVTITATTDGVVYAAPNGCASSCVSTSQASTLTFSGTFSAVKVAMTGLLVSSPPFTVIYNGKTAVANAAGSTFLAPDGSETSPAYSFINKQNTGFWYPGSGNNFLYSANGVKQAAFGVNAITLQVSNTVVWTSGADPTTGLDTFIGRSGVGILKVGNASQTYNNEGSLGDATHTLKDVFLNGNAGGNAATGAIGEIVSSQVTSGALVNLATTSATTITSITLTAGDWDITGVVDYRLNAATSVTVLKQGSALATGVFGAQDSATTFETAANVMTATVDPAFVIPVFRYSISATTIIYLTAQANFTVSTAQAYGTIRARRVR